MGELTPRQKEWLVEVDMPPPESINTGRSPSNRALLRMRLGEPSVHYTDKCGEVQPGLLHDRLVTRSVGPFRVTGLDVAVACLAYAMKRVKQYEPDLYDLLGSAGMLCCRKTRGSDSPSIHSWGCAVDITIGGKLDDYGDGKTLKGLFVLHQYMKQEGWYWGAEFRKEDSMHWELANDRLQTLLSLRGVELRQYIAGSK